MPRFMTRIELHKAKDTDYDTLHAAMKLRGFARVIQGDDGFLYHLPTAEYERSGNLTIAQVKASGKEAADTTGKSYGIIVTEWITASWDGLPRVS